MRSFLFMIPRSMITQFLNRSSVSDFFWDVRAVAKSHDDHEFFSAKLFGSSVKITSASGKRRDQQFPFVINIQRQKFTVTFSSKIDIKFNKKTIIIPIDSTFCDSCITLCYVRISRC